MAKYCPEIVEEICGYLKEGLTQKDSATLAGINNDTLHDWINTKSEFSESIKKAQVDAKKEMVDIVRKAAKKTWTAAAWWLERKHKDEFSLRQELTGKDGEELKAPIINLGPTGNKP